MWKKLSKIKRTSNMWPINNKKQKIRDSNRLRIGHTKLTKTSCGTYSINNKKYTNQLSTT